jgi:hypothetical protein
MDRRIYLAHGIGMNQGNSSWLKAIGFCIMMAITWGIWLVPTIIWWSLTRKKKLSPDEVFEKIEKKERLWKK